MHPVQRVGTTGGTVEDNALLGLHTDEVVAALEQKLEDSGRFRVVSRLPSDDAPAKKDEVPTGMKLEVAFTRESHKDGREGTWAEVGATLHLSRKVEGETFRYQVVGLGEEKVKGPDDRQRAMRAAFDAALGQLVQLADLQLAALGKGDRELLADLKHEDLRVQEFALRVLSERRNPAVVDVLIERLKTAKDPDQLRRLVGALSELRAQKAVKPLIELTRGKDPSFVREIVFSLAQIGGEEATAYLFTVAAGHDDPVIRAAAEKALAEIELRDRGEAKGRAQ